MPGLARLYVKTALVYMVLALAAGMVLLASQAAALPPALQALQPVYFHLFMVGWVTQLIFGVAWWMFPPLSRERPRGDERIAWLVYAALNGGLVLRAVAEPLQALAPSALWAQALVLAAALQTAAGWAFAIHLWPRVRGPQTARPRAAAKGK